MKVYDTPSGMFRVKNDEKLFRMPLILIGDEFDFYAENSISYGTYEGTTRLMSGWCNNGHKNVRVLIEW